MEANFPSRPLIGLLLRLVYQHYAQDIEAALREAGFTDLRPAHANVFPFVPPEGITVTELADLARNPYRRAGVLRFAQMLLLFLCFAHWLVVRANRAQPVRLDETWFLGGLAVFLVAVLFWTLAFLRQFRSNT